VKLQRVPHQRLAHQLVKHGVVFETLKLAVLKRYTTVTDILPDTIPDATLWLLANHPQHGEVHTIRSAHHQVVAALLQLSHFSYTELDSQPHIPLLLPVLPLLFGERLEHY
jgi:hypothetical protein